MIGSTESLLADGLRTQTRKYLMSLMLPITFVNSHGINKLIGIFIHDNLYAGYSVYMNNCGTSTLAKLVYQNAIVDENFQFAHWSFGKWKWNNVEST